MGVFDFMTEKTEDDLEHIQSSSGYVVLAVVAHPSGILQAMFFDADYFRFCVCESKQFKIIYTVFLLRSACPKGVIIYTYPDNNPCAFCEVDDCTKCPQNVEIPF